MTDQKVKCVVRDRFGKKLKIGDKVIYFRKTDSGVDAFKGKIDTFSEKLVYISCQYLEDARGMQPEPGWGKSPNSLIRVKKY